MSEHKTLFTNIEKSKSDKFDSLIKILPNGLKALLVSDPEAEQSGAALGVNIGSLSDSKDEVGLAHFCEHLVFMGTEKYPLESEIEEYLSKNGGDSNAYTGLDHTVYYFNVDNDAFEGAVDRFAQFFISPKFNEDTVDREINAINSEFNKNKNNDSWRMYQLFTSQLNAGAWSAIGYANRIFQFPVGILVSAFLVPLFPMFSRLVGEKNYDDVKKYFNKGIGVLNFIAFPILVGILLLAHDGVYMIFQRGQFNDEATAMVTTALLFLSFSIIPYVFRDCITRIFYSFNDSKTPFIIAVSSIIIKILLNMI